MNLFHYKMSNKVAVVRVTHSNTTEKIRKISKKGKRSAMGLPMVIAEGWPMQSSHTTRPFSLAVIG